MSMQKHHYAVIMAGGSGTRLWPLSRYDMPKQFHKLISSHKTLLQETYERIGKVVSRENIFISTTENYHNLVLRQLPHCSKKNLLIEPCARNTAPAMAFVAPKIFHKDSHALIATTPSDGVVKNPMEFVMALKTAFAACENENKRFGMIGINPTFPSTELGYIKMGTELQRYGDKRVFTVEAFKEKPDYKTAVKYLASWQYLWNAAYFVFSAKLFHALVKKHTPAITKTLSKMDIARTNRDRKNLYAALTDAPVDTAITEKLSADERFVVPSDLQWSDVGNWQTLHEFFKETSSSALVVKGNHVDVGSKNCLVYGSDKLIATIGLKDIVIVENNDVIFVAHKSEAKNIKKLLTKLKEQGMHHYF